MGPFCHPAKPAHLNSAMTLCFYRRCPAFRGALITALIFVFHEDEEMVKPQSGHPLPAGHLSCWRSSNFVGYQSKVTGIVTSLNIIAFGAIADLLIIHLFFGTLIPLIPLTVILTPRRAWACFFNVATSYVRFNFLISIWPFIN
jgi:hypothetical protein